jgi:putative oxidoreductase
VIGERRSVTGAGDGSFPRSSEPVVFAGGGAVHHPRPASVRDTALLVARLLLGTIMFAHGYQKLMLDGIGRTTQGFEHMSIPAAIVSASFVTVVEVVGGVLLVAGLFVAVVATLEGFVMLGAAVFVHLSHGIFVADGGWELVGAIGAGLVAVAASGPGRWSVAHLIEARRARPAAVPVTPPSAFEPAPSAFEPVPPAGLPLLPMVRLDHAGDPRTSGLVPSRHHGSPPMR